MQLKYLYLFDTCAWVYYYEKNPDIPNIKGKIEHLIEQKGLNQATLFMPNFCIAEVFNTFAKWRYREGRISSDEEYDEIKKSFRKHIRRGILISELPLHIYHIYNADYIIPFEHQWEIGKKQDWRLSTFDILIISMGIELVKHFGDENVRIITCEDRIEFLCRQLRDNVNTAVREKYEIPKDILYPRAINLRTAAKRQLPCVKGQKL